MVILSFIFVLAAAILFAAAAWTTKSLVAAGLCLFSLGFMFLYTTTGSLVHF